MSFEDIEKKDLVRTVLKDVVIKSLGEILSLMKLEVSDDNIRWYTNQRVTSYKLRVNTHYGFC